jgi:dephospho-CoA kinase
VLLVGLTGGIGSGKSTVSALLAARGAVVVDADAIVREVQAVGGAAYEGIVERFGPAVVAEDGSLDRAALAAIVFSDPAAREDLGTLTYPHVGAAMAARVAAHAETDDVVVLDIPLLAERGGKEAYGVAAVIVVDCPVEEAVRRLVELRGLAEEDARARVAAQASRQDRVALADYVLDNGGPLAALEAQVEACWAWLLGLRHAAETPLSAEPDERYASGPPLQKGGEG